MITLLVRMALLPGSRDGVMFYLVPDFEKVAEMQVVYVYSNCLHSPTLTKDVVVCTFTYKVQSLQSTYVLLWMIYMYMHVVMQWQQDE